MGVGRTGLNIDSVEYLGSAIQLLVLNCHFVFHFQGTALFLLVQGDPREPDIFKINNTQLFFQVNSHLFIQN